MKDLNESFHLKKFHQNQTLFAKVIAHKPPSQNGLPLMPFLYWLDEFGALALAPNID